ncbi:MAG TPA: alpha/beta hydrolase [Caulobacteraceae bacterium]|jgi:pimeloyl-ACP methyl ester carboxylesterase|nr:alpha/beta hydrolase [Caulobacteraceae bacterium]
MTLTSETGAAAAHAPRRRTFDIRSRGHDARLAALEFGDPSRPIDVLFLHANGFNAMTYRGILAPLAAGLRILAVDQQGHGLSPQRGAAEGRTDWLDFGDDLLALLDRLDQGPMVLAGHSMGGAVSVMATAEKPSRVRALALFDPVLVFRAARAAAAGGGAADNPLALGADRRRAVFPDREMAFKSYHGRGAFRTWPDEAIRDYITDGFRDRPDGTVELSCAPAWEASSFRAHGHDPWPSMRKVFKPVRILRAEAGSTCGVETPAEFNPDNPDVVVRTIPGSTHFLPIERPNLVRETLLELTRG